MVLHLEVRYNLLISLTLYDQEKHFITYKSNQTKQSQQWGLVFRVLGPRLCMYQAKIVYLHVLSSTHLNFLVIKHNTVELLMMISVDRHHRNLFLSQYYH